MVLIQVNRMEDTGHREADWVHDRTFDNDLRDRTYYSDLQDRILGYNKTWYGSRLIGWEI